MYTCSTALAARAVSAAVRIAERVVASARWADGACTWEVIVSDNTGPGRPLPLARVANGGIYQGTAGIALFLTEVYAVTGAPEARRAARGALCHALRAVADLGPESAFSFHTGRVGVAYALSRYAEATADDESLAEARALLSPIFGSEERERIRDVIGGAAGAIPVLLQLARVLDLPAARASAVSLGEGLIACARRQPNGSWSWRSVVGGSARDLCGFAHGAAGIAAGLLELWAVTREPRFRYAAQRGFAYEGAEFDAAEGNWPDFRCLEWSQALAFPSRMEDMRARLRAGVGLPRYRRSYMTAWCHGAPGIGLSRLRAADLLGDQQYAAEARIAGETTRRVLAEGCANFSLCHGAFGNCEMLLWGAQALEILAWRDDVEHLVDSALTASEAANRPWRCGTLHGIADPSLLLGESGIGLFLLRLAYPNIPSVLFPLAPSADVTAAVALVDEDERLIAMEQDEESAWFGRSLRAFTRLGATASVRAAAAARSDLPPLVALAEAVKTVAAAPGARGALLADAARLELSYWECVRAMPDDIDALVDQCCRPPLESLEWDTVRVRLAPSTLIVTHSHDWDSWLAGDHADSSPEPAVAPARTYVLFYRAGAVHVQRLGSLGRGVLAAVAEAGPLGLDAQAASDAVVEMIDGSKPIEAVLPLVASQLRSALAAGIVELANRVELGEPATDMSSADAASPMRGATRSRPSRE